MSEQDETPQAPPAEPVPEVIAQAGLASAAGAAPQHEAPAEPEGEG